MAKSKKAAPNANLDLTRVTRTVYFIIITYAATIIIFDAGNLITRESVIHRWSLASLLLLVNTVVWFASSQRKAKTSRNAVLTYLLVMALLFTAGITTYWERGMASTSTIFYVLPLLVAATLRNRHALLAAAVLSAGTYSFMAVKYFNDFFNEGYRVQLWGHLFLYSGTILAIAWLIMIISGLRHDSR